MKVALIQTNPIIGDFAANCRTILDYANQAASQQCQLAVFPELAISGYPPLDLLERSSFIDDHQRFFKKLRDDLPDIHVLLGILEPRSASVGKKLYNSAVIVKAGAVQHTTRKKLLPSYDVFDESRYFAAGSAAKPYTIEGLTFGVTICEDIWNYTISEYPQDPVTELIEVARQQGTSLDYLINISASPYHRGKDKIRNTLFSTICNGSKLPLFYVNQVGGQDSLIFDGQSRVLDATGQVRGLAPAFAEDMIIYDTRTGSGDIRKISPEPEVAMLHGALMLGLRDYVLKSGFRSVVLGLSGGIDSALTAALAVAALGKENVFGVALPSPYSSTGSVEDARALAENLGCRFEILPISGLFELFCQALEPVFEGRPEGVTEQNIQARIRGNVLMALANKFGCLLLTTGNKSEMAVGYCTLYGDMSGGLAVISDVPKLQVYELAHYVNRSQLIIPVNTIEKPPSAELQENQVDQDDLPAYEILDQVLELYLEKGLGVQEIIMQGFEAAVVGDIIKRIRVNEYKRKQAPMGLKVTSKAFGFGRRLPNVQGYLG